MLRRSHGCQTLTLTRLLPPSWARVRLPKAYYIKFASNAASTFFKVFLCVKNQSVLKLASLSISSCQNPQSYARRSVYSGKVWIFSFQMFARRLCSSMPLPVSAS